MKSKIFKIGGLLMGFLITVCTGAMASLDSLFSARVWARIGRIDHGDGFVVALSDITSGMTRYVKGGLARAVQIPAGVFLGKSALIGAVLFLTIAVSVVHPVEAGNLLGSGVALIGIGAMRFDYDEKQQLKVTGSFDQLKQAWDSLTRDPRYAHLRNDADGMNLFFARQLEYIIPEVLKKAYPEYKATRLIPVSSEVGPGATTITLRMYDRAGSFALISNYANDLPRTSVKASEKRIPVKPFGGSYGYNLDEIRSAKFANVPLEMLEADACRENYEQLLNKIAWQANPLNPEFGGLTGLVYQPNCILSQPANGLWTTTNAGNAAKIYQDMIDAVAAHLLITNDIEQPDTMLLGLQEYVAVTTTPLVIGSGGSSIGVATTVADFFLEHNPSIKEIERVTELGNVSPPPSDPTDYTSLTSVMITYKRDPRKLKYHIPQPFEQLPPQERGLEWIINCHAKVAGVLSPYPMSIMITELDNPASAS